MAGEKNRTALFDGIDLPDTRIQKVVQVEADTLAPGQPEFVRVYLLSKPGKGSHILSEVWLPKDWNGIFLGLGNGGMAGSIHHGWLMPYLKSGYAVACTDMGTSRGRESGIGNPDVVKDFGWRATHLMTEAGKSVVRRYYGEDARYSYFVGHSTGGQQALAEAQRFPEDYDGILGGVPANNRTHLHTYFLWAHNHFRPREIGPLFTREDVYAITAAATEFHQKAGDGVPGDDFVTIPRADEAFLDEMVRYIGAKNPSFDKLRLDALRAVYDGPINPRTGERIYNGIPAGAERYGCGIYECQAAESPHFYPFIWTFGADYDGYRFDFDRDLDRVNETLAADLNANSADLSAFRERGGKLILFSGSADPCVPYPDAMRYYDRVAAASGGYDSAMEFARWCLFPGRDHGSGGLGVNAVWADESGVGELIALRRWREEGIAPAYMIGTAFHGGNPANGIHFMRRVYAYDGKNAGACPPVCCDRYLK